MHWLDPATLDALYDAAVDADLVDRDTRAVLLQGVPDDVRLSLPDHNRPDLQFRSDLSRLNEAAPGRPPPLRGWLAEAAHLAEGRPQARVFTDALAVPDPVADGGVGEASTDARPEPPPDPPPDPPPEPPPEPPADAPGGLAGWWAGIGDRGRTVAVAGAAGLGLLALVTALAIGGPDPDAPDAALSDAAPADATALADATAPDGPLFVPPTADLPLLAPVAPATAQRPALRPIPPGRWTLPDRRTLTLPGALAMTATPVTRGQYRALMQSVPGPDAPDAAPVRGATLAQARAYADALSRSEGRAPFHASEGPGDGYRLPDEDTWTLACHGARATPRAPHPWGLDRLGADGPEWTDSRFAPTPGAAHLPGAGQALRGGAPADAPLAERCGRRAEARGGRSDDAVFRVVRPLEVTAIRRLDGAPLPPPLGAKPPDPPR